MTNSEYIRVAATARHLAETVFNRAAENDVKLSARTVKNILLAAAELAMITHRGEP